jgi:hypothetical protein
VRRRPSCRGDGRKPGRASKLPICSEIEFTHPTGFQPLRGDIEIDGVGRTGSSGLTLSGMASARVARVALHYRKGPRLIRQNAAFVRVVDRDLLNKIEPQDAFGYYLADVPQGARSIAVAAFDESGRRSTARPCPWG